MSPPESVAGVEWRSADPVLDDGTTPPWTAALVEDVVAARCGRPD
ncbi:hypothetical protein [Halolamina litorea]|uniref:Uncharacterized protein n=1 Tax=Halolamina litorea TaxID=1515593 RepID=A0ABD6BLU7_9EURY|nr:hypothetical protein [Halolamina litorea]